jgi:signal transduction histidine kinase
MDGSPIAGQRILTIDDSRAIRVFLAQLITGRGAELEEAGTGAEALALYESGRRFDIVLLDLVLPDTDGFELLRRIREIDPETTIVMLTGSGSVRSATSAVRAGADGYMEKQHLVSGQDEDELLDALVLAREHREGVVARQQLESVRADFYSMVTHDLRTPTGNIAASLKVVLSGKAGELTDRQRQLLEVAERSAGKLLGLVNDYLDFSKIDAGYLRIERGPADLRDILALSVRQNTPQAAARQQTIELDLPGEAVEGSVDRERLEQVFDNLVSNAIKYTPEGGQVVARLRQEGESAVVVISDTGRGLSTDAMMSLFTKYGRVPGAGSRGVTGTGLGLLIVKEIVQAHGGDVRAESEGRDRGSSFVVTLPLTGA